MPLTELQRRFVDACLTEPNATQAYLKAGGGARTDEAARAGAHELLTNPNVGAALAAARGERARRVRVDADWVVARLVEVVDRCLQASPVYDSLGEPTG